MSTDPSTRWIDLEPIVDALSGVLGSGELVHDANFSLFDALNALEIGDAKMDSGAKRAEDVVTLAQMIEQGRAPIDVPYDDALVRMMDALLACEATFRSGHALATTLWSNAYALDRSARLDDATCNPVLRAFVRATVASASTARHVVQLGDVYEEEDFATQDFGVELGPHAGRDDVIEDEVLMALESASRAMDEAGVKDGKLRDAIRARLEFRAAHHEMMKTLIRAVGSGSSGVATHAAKSAQQAKVHLAKMREFYADSDVDEKEMDWDPNGGSFSRDMSLHLLGGAPPRTVNFISSRAAVNYFEKEIDDVLIAAEVFDYRAAKSLPTLEDVLESLEKLQMARPGAVALGLAAAELLHEKQLCGAHFGHIAMNSAWSLIGIKRTKLDESFAHSKEAVDKFFEECVQPLTILIRSFCVNRARFRRVLRRILGEFSHLQVACDEIDAAVKLDIAKPGDADNVEILKQTPAVFIAWAEYLTAYAEQRHLELGFSLDLYQPHEFQMIYYYIFYLREIRMVWLKRQTLATSPADRPDAQYKLAASQLYLSMCCALRFTFAALADQGKIRKCETPFSGEDLRYWQRFSSFQSVELPPPITYEEYSSNVEAHLERYSQVMDGENPTDAQIYAKIADLFYTEVKTLAGLFARPAGSPNAERTRQKYAADVAATAKIGAKNAVSLKLLLASDMTCECDHASHEMFVTLAARRNA